MLERLQGIIPKEKGKEIPLPKIKFNRDLKDEPYTVEVNPEKIGNLLRNFYVPTRQIGRLKITIQKERLYGPFGRETNGIYNGDNKITLSTYHTWYEVSSSIKDTFMNAVLQHELGHLIDFYTLFPLKPYEEIDYYKHPEYELFNPILEHRAYDYYDKIEESRSGEGLINLVPKSLSQQK